MGSIENLVQRLLVEVLLRSCSTVSYILPPPPAPPPNPRPFGLSSLMCAVCASN